MSIYTLRLYIFVDFEISVGRPINVQKQLVCLELLFFIERGSGKSLNTKLCLKRVIEETNIPLFEYTPWNIAHT